MIKFICDRCFREVKAHSDLIIVKMNVMDSDRENEHEFELCSGCMNYLIKIIKDGVPNQA